MMEIQLSTLMCPNDGGQEFRTKSSKLPSGADANFAGTIVAPLDAMGHMGLNEVQAI